MTEHALATEPVADASRRDEATRATAERAAIYFTERELTDGRDLASSFRLRYEVYCREKRFLSADDYPDGQETDRYDRSSWHYGSFDNHGNLVGTVRLVRGAIDAVPLSEHCTLTPAWASHLRGLGELAEFSRLAINPLYRRRQGDGLYAVAKASVGLVDGHERRPTMPVILRLYRLMYRSMKREGREHFLAAMDSSLSDVFKKYGFPFQEIGPEVDYYGPVVPYYLNVGELEAVLRRAMPELAMYFAHGLDR